jgi:hypothetical protein
MKFINHKLVQLLVVVPAKTTNNQQRIVTRAYSLRSSGVREFNISGVA